MTKFLYFAYGSNMLAERLIDRTSTASLVGAAQAINYDLAFTKRSADGSGKAMLEWTGNPDDTVYGVLYEIDLIDRKKLDRAEGAPGGYYREEKFAVIHKDTEQPVWATTYLAQSDFIDPSLTPYEWYYALVLAGGKQHNLPKAWIDKIAATPYSFDPNRESKGRQDAVAILKKAGMSALLPL